MTRIDGHELEKIGSFLRKGVWFGGLPAALQERILRRSVLRSYKKGGVISGEGLVPQGLQALLEGRIQIFRHAGAEDLFLVHVAEPGFWFGEVAMLTGRAAVVSVMAETDVRTVLFPTAEFERTVGEEPGFYRPLANLVIERYATVLGFLAQVGGLSAEARLRQRLADLVALRRLKGTSRETSSSPHRKPLWPACSGCRGRRSTDYSGGWSPRVSSTSGSAVSG